MEVDLTKTFQWALIIFLCLACVNYIWLIWDSKYSVTPIETDKNVIEGFSDARGITDSEQAQLIWYENDELFDSFYVSIYDKIMQLERRFPAEVLLIFHKWKKSGDSDTMDILDCGCGTGIATILFAKNSVNSVVGLDLSEHMLRQARTKTLRNAKLPLDIQETVQFIKGDMMNEYTFEAGRFSHACLLFFTFYYADDPLGLFKNMFHWIRPGGQLAIEVVNKYKFDPMPEASSSLVGVSIQKYSEKRVTKSSVVFDKFTYESEFDLQDPDAEFREVFRFKDKSVRRQRHSFVMRDTKEIVALGERAGWKYEGYIDLMPVGFEYAYVLMFTHP